MFFKAIYDLFSGNSDFIVGSGSRLRRVVLKLNWGLMDEICVSS